MCYFVATCTAPHCSSDEPQRGCSSWAVPTKTNHTHAHNHPLFLIYARYGAIQRRWVFVTAGEQPKCKWHGTRSSLPNSPSFTLPWHMDWSRVAPGCFRDRNVVCCLSLGQKIATQAICGVRRGRRGVTSNRPNANRPTSAITRRIATGTTRSHPEAKKNKEFNKGAIRKHQRHLTRPAAIALAL